MMLGNTLFLLLILIVGWQLFKRSDLTNSKPSARDILDQRYAKGELMQSEYEQLKHDIAD